MAIVRPADCEKTNPIQSQFVPGLLDGGVFLDYLFLLLLLEVGQFFAEACIGKGKDLHGVQIHLIDPKKVELMKTQFYFLQAVHELYPDKNLFDEATKGQGRAVNKALGTDRVINKFTENYMVEDILQILNEDLKSYKSAAVKYYLYK